MLQLQEITTYQEFLALEERWNGLVEKSLLNSIFVRHEWIRCLWDAYGQEQKMFILLFWEEDVLRAIAPLKISTGKFRERFPVRQISFIETDESPHAGLIVDFSCDIEQVLNALLVHLKSCKSSWDILLLRKIHKESSLLTSFPVVATERRESLVVKGSLRSPVLYMNSDWESFYTATSQRFKKKLRYDRNKLKRIGEVDIQLFNTPEQIAGVIEEVFAVGRRSWKEEIGNSIGSIPQNRMFFSKLPRVLGQGGNEVLLWTLSLDGKIIAFEYHVRQGDKVYALRGEFDEDYHDSSPGAVLDGEVVQQLFEQGVRVYDMCGDASNQYKLRWTKDVQPYCEVILFNRNIRGVCLEIFEKQILPLAKRLKPVVEKMRKK
jgi:CelD/BcsL family acetyltransferase involved in cellulose biosynthesis